MTTKIGKRELEIIEYLQQRGKQSYAQIAAEFAPIRRGLPEYNVIDRRLDRMEMKGYILVEHDGRKMIRLRGDLLPFPTEKETV